jgi:hypothetical protein
VQHIAGPAHAQPGAPPCLPLARGTAQPALRDCLHYNPVRPGRASTQAQRRETARSDQQLLRTSLSGTHRGRAVHYVEGASFRRPVGAARVTVSLVLFLFLLLLLSLPCPSDIAMLGACSRLTRAFLRPW